MMFRTHVALGILIGIFVLPVVNPDNWAVFLFLVAFASGLPDIDHPGSVMGRKVKIIGWLFDHRGFFHSFFAVALFFFGILAFSKNIEVALAIAIGYLSHLVGDALTHEGIAPFNPILKFRISGFFSTGHLIEHLFFYMISFAIIIVSISTLKIF